ncbi:MAG: hypothetical protein COW69_01720 [Candidatus Huberarchaeum crystalense]|uniref:Uncharacterized protein n=1 Tax=Huberarchaeum crystalense TaxID=2014257 RepID=A0A2G9LJ08_HUBC1|nr:MAG: hypothetical protein COW69_01720 [Candidatus Huberarchaeum crystalense]
MNRANLNTDLKNSAEFLKRAISNEKRIAVISHLDADGITSASIMFNLLKGLGANFQLRLIKQAEKKIIKTISEINADLFIFLDMGSGQKEILSQYIEKDILILDHHHPEGNATGKTIEINIDNYGFNGSTESSASTLCYLFSKFAGSDFGEIQALVGALGDQQEMVGLNKEVLDIAIKKNIITIHKDLNLFGRQTKPVFQALCYSDLDLPKTTWEVQQIFQDIIDIDEVKDKTYAELPIEIHKKMISKIIEYKLSCGKNNFDNFLTDFYFFNEAIDGSEMKSLREFAVVLNSCGRQKETAIGILFAENPKKYYNQVSTIYKIYKQNLAKLINWFDSKESNAFIENKGVLTIIKPNNVLKPDVVGVVSSIYFKLKNSEIIIGAAYDEELELLKISCRSKKQKINNTLKTAAKFVGGSGGGHDLAGGAYIAQDKFEDFCKVFEEEIKKEAKP